MTFKESHSYSTQAKALLIKEKIYDIAVTGIEKNIMATLSHKNGLSTREIAEEVELSARQVRKYLIA